MLMEIIPTVNSLTMHLLQDLIKDSHRDITKGSHKVITKDSLQDITKDSLQDITKDSHKVRLKADNITLRSMHKVMELLPGMDSKDSKDGAL